MTIFIRNSPKFVSSALIANLIQQNNLSPAILVVRKKMSVFVQSLNPMTGSTCWEEKDPDYDFHQEVARSAFADMLHDHERNEKYYHALKAAIDKKHILGEKANVLDIGTGTGLLSMMAAKCGADTITACEAFRPMANCAIRIIRENGYADKIKLIPKRSTELTVGDDGDMQRRANILVTEVFDTELIGEGALSTFSHAQAKLLEPDSIVVPSSATVWAQVVDSQTVRAWSRMNPIYDSSGTKILIDTPPLIKSCVGPSSVNDIQLSRLSRESFAPLTNPFAICRFDWSGKEPLKFDETFRQRVKAVASGTTHAVFVWWDLDMDTEGNILLSCAPVWDHPDVRSELRRGTDMEVLADKIPWRDHWLQAVYSLPSEHQISEGQEFFLTTSHDEYSFWFRVDDGSATKIINGTVDQRPACDCSLHLAYSRTRIGQMNDKERSAKYVRLLEKLIEPGSMGVCLSNGSLLGLAAAKLGAKKVVVFETNEFSRRAMESYIEFNDLADKVEIVDSADKLPTSKEVDWIFGEPNFGIAIVPWDNLYFWHLASKYPKEVRRIPIVATIKAVALEFKDLHKIRAPLGICEGFDLSTFDELVEASSELSDSPVEPQPLWEYPSRALSLPYTVARIDFDTNINEQETIKTSDAVSILCSGTCNGVGLWVDWTLDDGTEVTTGPTSQVKPGSRVIWYPHARQGVYLPRKTVSVTTSEALSWSMNFSPSTGEIHFNFRIVNRNE